MKVKVADGYQIHHDGKLYVGGQSVDAPEALAKRWVDSGLAKKVKPKKKAAAKSKNKAVKSSANKSLEG